MRFLGVFTLIFFGILSLSPVRALSVLPLSVTSMTKQAGVVFQGRFLSSEEALDESGLPATYLKFEVLQGFKGISGQKTLLIKQFGRMPSSVSALKVAEGEKKVVALKNQIVSEAYEPDQEYLLFFYPESRLGFTSPVGGGQGRLQIVNPPSHSASLSLDRQVVLPLQGERFLSEVLDELAKAGSR